MAVQLGDRRGKYVRHSDRVSVTGFRGVTLKDGKYHASISIVKKRGDVVKVHIGIYDTPLEAHNARIAFIDNLK